jgi:hypothetical protein
MTTSETGKQLVRRAAVEMFGESIGCSDSGCVFGHPGGMHTNGGCRCARTDPKVSLQKLRYISLYIAESACKTGSNLIQ